MPRPLKTRQPTQPPQTPQATQGLPSFLNYAAGEQTIQLGQRLHQLLAQAQQVAQKPAIPTAPLFRETILPLIDLLIGYMVSSGQDHVRYSMNVAEYLSDKMSGETHVELAVPPDLADTILEALDGAVEELKDTSNLLEDISNLLKGDEDLPAEAQRALLERVVRQSAAIEGITQDLDDIGEAIDEATFDERDAGEENTPTQVGMENVRGARPREPIPHQADRLPPEDPNDYTEEPLLAE